MATTLGNPLKMVAAMGDVADVKQVSMSLSSDSSAEMDMHVAAQGDCDGKEPGELTAPPLAVWPPVNFGVDKKPVAKLEEKSSATKTDRISALKTNSKSGEKCNPARTTIPMALQTKQPAKSSTSNTVRSGQTQAQQRRGVPKRTAKTAQKWTNCKSGSTSGSSSRSRSRRRRRCGSSGRDTARDRRSGKGAHWIDVAARAPLADGSVSLSDTPEVAVKTADMIATARKTAGGNRLGRSLRRKLKKIGTSSDVRQQSRDSRHHSSTTQGQNNSSRHGANLHVRVQDKSGSHPSRGNDSNRGRDRERDRDRDWVRTRERRFDDRPPREVERRRDGERDSGRTQRDRVRDRDVTRDSRMNVSPARGRDRVNKLNSGRMTSKSRSRSRSGRLRDARQSGTQRKRGSSPSGSSSSKFRRVSSPSGATATPVSHVVAKKSREVMKSEGKTDGKGFGPSRCGEAAGRGVERVVYSRLGSEMGTRTRTGSDTRRSDELRSVGSATSHSRRMNSNGHAQKSSTRGRVNGKDESHAAGVLTILGANITDPVAINAVILKLKKSMWVGRARSSSDVVAHADVGADVLSGENIVSIWKTFMVFFASNRNSFCMHLAYLWKLVTVLVEGFADVVSLAELMELPIEFFCEMSGSSNSRNALRLYLEHVGSYTHSWLEDKLVRDLHKLTRGAGKSGGVGLLRFAFGHLHLDCLVRITEALDQSCTKLELVTDAADKSHAQFMLELRKNLMVVLRGRIGERKKELEMLRCSECGEEEKCDGGDVTMTESANVTDDVVVDSGKSSDVRDGEEDRFDAVLNLLDAAREPVKSADAKGVGVETKARCDSNSVGKTKDGSVSGKKKKKKKKGVSCYGRAKVNRKRKLCDVVPQGSGTNNSKRVRMNGHGAHVMVKNEQCKEEEEEKEHGECEQLPMAKIVYKRYQETGEEVVVPTSEEKFEEFWSSRAYSLVTFELQPTTVARNVVVMYNEIMGHKAAAIERKDIARDIELLTPELREHISPFLHVYLHGEEQNGVDVCASGGGGGDGNVLWFDSDFIRTIFEAMNVHLGIPDGIYQAIFLDGQTVLNGIDLIVNDLVKMYLSKVARDETVVFVLENRTKRTHAVVVCSTRIGVYFVSFEDDVEGVVLLEKLFGMLAGGGSGSGYLNLMDKKRKEKVATLLKLWADVGTHKIVLPCVVPARHLGMTTIHSWLAGWFAFIFVGLDACRLKDGVNLVMSLEGSIGQVSKQLLGDTLSLRVLHYVLAKLHDTCC